MPKKSNAFAMYKATRPDPSIKFVLKNEVNLAVKAFMNLGLVCGFFEAERTLLMFLPIENPDGRVCDIEPRRIRAFRTACCDKIDMVTSDDPDYDLDRDAKKLLREDAQHHKGKKP